MLIEFDFTYDVDVHSIDYGNLIEACSKHEGTIPELLADVASVFDIPVENIAVNISGETGSRLTFDFPGACLSWDCVELKRITDEIAGLENWTEDLHDCGVCKNCCDGCQYSLMKDMDVGDTVIQAGQSLTVKFVDVDNGTFECEEDGTWDYCNKYYWQWDNFNDNEGHWESKE